MIASKTSQLAAQFEIGETVCVSFHYHNKFNITFLNSLVTKVLSRSNMIHLRDTVVTVLKEIIVNAVKANSKTHFFKLNNLNIADRTDYDLGMRDFKTFIIQQKEGIGGRAEEKRFQG